MPFNPSYKYGSNTDSVTHASVPADGRRIVTADFAVMYVNNHSVGMVQRFTPTETRPVAPQYEIGNIYPVEFVPQPWQGQLQVQRLEIFKNALYSAFGFNNFLKSSPGGADLTPYWPSDKRDAQGNPIVTSLADVQWPIDISIHIANPPAAGNTLTVKTYKECWVTQIGTSYDAGAKVVSENCSFTFRNVVYDEAQSMIGLIGADPNAPGFANSPAA